MFNLSRLRFRFAGVVSVSFASASAIRISIYAFCFCRPQSRAVVPFQPDARTAEQGGKSIEGFNRRREVGEVHAVQPGQGIDRVCVSRPGHFRAM
jgi:hypothetical protein